MTDKEQLRLLRSAIADLKRTTRGYVQFAEEGGTWWPSALGKLARLEKDLVPVAVPPLGPVWAGGRSVLQQSLTHATAGIPLYPAFDDAYVQGRLIIAPEPLTIIAPYTSSRPGMAFYARGKSKLRYWFGHLDRHHPIGTTFVKGQTVGRVAPNTVGGGPHVHVGLNVELLLGAGVQLEHHTNYTTGAPTVGVQLARALNT